MSLGINLHNVVRDVIETLNPDEDLILYQALEQTTLDGWNLAQYAAPVTVKGQVQSTPTAITQADGLNTNVDDWTIWLYSDSITQPGTVDRYTGRTGDMIQREDGRWYLVTGVNTDFSRIGWISVTATLQTKGVEESQVVTTDDSTDDS